MKPSTGNSTQTLKWAIVTGIIGVVFCTGCITARKVTTAGPLFSTESLAFLNEKDVTRNEVVSTLGSPSYESSNLHVIAYLSETSTHYHFFGFLPTLFPDDDHVFGIKPVSESENDNPRMRALLIAYDQTGVVKAHSIRNFGYRRPLADICSEYSASLIKSKPE